MASQEGKLMSSKPAWVCREKPWRRYLRGAISNTSLLPSGGSEEVLKFLASCFPIALEGPSSGRRDGDMSAAVPLPSSALWRVPGCRSGSRPPSRANFAPLGDVSMPFPLPRGDGDDNSSLERRMMSPATQVDESSHYESKLRFDRLQLPELECNRRYKRAFGRFIAREALLDEEFWTAAWLRAESHWEDKSYVRHVESYKRKFADQEFASIKRRCSEQNAEKCTCIVVVKREEKNVKRTVLNSIVGTLDVSIRFLLQDETFPGERMRASVFSSIYKVDRPRYAYVANLCVAKHARRQGIATNMLNLAAKAAKSYGVNQIFVHVHEGRCTSPEVV